MNKFKICVYAISKNESKFVDRWCDSVSEADAIYVLDTGSEDDTVKKLKKKNVNVTTKIIKPWRFDIARNESLKLIPEEYDICVCLDLDEVIKKGWRKELENIWEKDTTRLRYDYNWKLDENDKPEINFYIEKIHSRKDYIWKHPVHEVLEYIGKEKENFITTDKISVNHYPDKEKSRGSYLELLELSVKEEPKDDRNMHYLGREYMYYGQYEKSIETLKKHLKLKTATWKDERCASMRFIARSYSNLNNYKEAKKWLEKAINEANYLRDPYMEMAILEYKNNKHNNCIMYCLRALDIDLHTKSYINEIFSFDETPYDLLSICYYNIGNIEKALYYIEKAIEINNKNERLINNKKIFLEKLQKNC